MSSVYEGLTPPQKKRYKSLLSSAKSMQKQGKLMFKDLEKLKNRVGDTLGKMPEELTADIKKSLDDFLPEGNVETQLNKAKDQINDMLKKLDKEYTSMRKSGGLLPERNIKAARALKRKKK